MNPGRRLEGIAAGWSEQSQPKRAARPHGAAEGRLNAVGLSIRSFATGSAVRDRFLRSARRSLCDQGWDAAWNAGRARGCRCPVR